MHAHSTLIVVVLKNRRVQVGGPDPAEYGSSGPGLAELLESCFPLRLCHRETRAGPRKKEGTLKQPDQDQTETFLAVVPHLKGEPVESRGKCEAPADGYNHPLKPWECVLFFPIWATSVAVIFLDLWFYMLFI